MSTKKEPTLNPNVSTFCIVNCRTSSDGLANSHAKNMRRTSNEKDMPVHTIAMLVFNGKMNILKRIFWRVVSRNGLFLRLQY